MPKIVIDHIDYRTMYVQCAMHIKIMSTNGFKSWSVRPLRTETLLLFVEMKINTCKTQNTHNTIESKM